MKIFLCLIASMSITFTACAGINMQADDKVPEPQNALPAVKTEESSRKTRLSAPSKANRTSRHFVLKDNCLRFTGSRLLPEQNGDSQRCVTGNGRVYIRKAADTSVIEMLR